MRLRVLALGALAASSVALTACEKPVPSVSVWSGTTTERAPAACWAFDPEEALDAEACLAGADENARGLEVRPGQRIGISVDAAVAEHGWFPAIGEARLTAEPIEETFFGFALGEQDFAEGGLNLRVVALDEGGEGRGIWSFDLSRA